MKLGVFSAQFFGRKFPKPKNVMILVIMIRSSKATVPRYKVSLFPYLGILFVVFCVVFCSLSPEEW